MGSGEVGTATFPSVRIDVSEGIDPADFAPLPTHDRVFVGGRTVWTGPFEPPVIVSQPNRWGVIEQGFPTVPCIVEADPVVTGHLGLPEDVRGFLDRAHRPIDPPRPDPPGSDLMRAAARFCSMASQLKGVGPAAQPFARTVPLIIPQDVGVVLAELEADGIIGARPLPEMAGGIALTVHPEHTDSDLRHVVMVLERALGR